MDRFYNIVIQPDEDGGYYAFAPSVPGVAEQGETFEEAAKNMAVALDFHLECMLEDGEELPPEDGPGELRVHRAVV